MVKKPNVKVPAIVIIRLILFLFIGLVLSGSYSMTVEFLTTSPLFSVRDVSIDTSIQFIDTSDLKRLKGRNIFDVDVIKLHNKIKSRYPQISELRVMRELPDRIKVLAKKRDAVFQIPLKSKILLVDREAVAMYYIAAPHKDLPLVQGVGGFKVILGAQLKVKPVSTALSIIGAFRSHPHTSHLKITGINVANSSKIEVALGPMFHVILDQDNYARKLELLDMLLAQKKVDFNSVRYIDLRFNEPVLGENERSQ